MREMKKMIVLFLLGNLLALATSAIADTDKMFVSMNLMEEYSDNIFLDTNQEKDDFITTLSPGVGFQKKDERTSAILKGIFDVVMYSDYTALDNVDQFYSADISHKLTPRLSLSGNVSYKRDSRPDRDIEKTGLVLGTDVRKTQNYRAGFGYILSEKASVRMGYAHNRDNFDDPAETDSDSHSVDVQLRYDLSDWFPLAVGRVSSMYSRYHYPDTKDDSYSLTFGVEKKVTEIYSFYADLGGRYNKPENREDSYGGVVFFGLRYNGELTSGKVSFSHDIRPASGETGLRERTSLVLSANRKFTETFAGRLTCGYHMNKSNSGELAINEIDKRTIQINPSLSYMIAEHVRLETAYKYTQVLDKEASSDDTKDRNLVFVRLVVNQPFFE